MWIWKKNYKFAYIVGVFLNQMNGLVKHFVLIVRMMIDSWLFYLIVLGFGFLAIYLMDIGIFKWWNRIRMPLARNYYFSSQTNNLARPWARISLVRWTFGYRSKISWIRGQALSIKRQAASHKQDTIERYNKNYERKKITIQRPVRSSDDEPGRGASPDGQQLEALRCCYKD